MLKLADVVLRHGPAYMERHGASMMPSRARAVKDILRCRTPEMGGHVAACPECGTEHLLYHSCGNRACPRCGYDTTTRWIDRQRDLLLPVRYFHVVFTLPPSGERRDRAQADAVPELDSRFTQPVREQLLDLRGGDRDKEPGRAVASRFIASLLCAERPGAEPWARSARRFQRLVRRRVRRAAGARRSACARPRCARRSAWTVTSGAAT